MNRHRLCLRSSTLSVKVCVGNRSGPSVLSAGCSNEGQFAFNVESIVMPQKLKGTLTYMIKVNILCTVATLQSYITMMLSYEDSRG